MWRTAVLMAVLLVSACGGSVAAPPTSPVPSARSDCPVPESGFDCGWQRSFAAARTYVAGRPGT
ncbi:MAG: hypothetical protein M3443_13700, partial [Actinomycetota bacterium]|nr:hypothetical protein [Actinomycetota bacterium]